MTLELPLAVKSIEFADVSLSDSSHFRISYDNLKVNERDFIIRVKSIATYRVTDGDNITVDVCYGADEPSVSLFLNGSVFGAVLHQKAMLPLHGSSFVFEGKGVIICGSSGAGKSSISYAICQDGGQFINDDITPIKVSATGAKIVPINSRVKLWGDTLNLFSQEKSSLDKIRPELNKFYVPLNNALKSERELDHIIILTIGSDCNYQSYELNGIQKYNAIRRNIYRKFYLKGMPDTERLYINQLFTLAQKVRVTHVVRPLIGDVMESAKFVKNLLLSGD